MAWRPCTCTHIVAELHRPHPHGAVLAWIRAIPDADLYLSAVTLGEIQAGIEITREQDPAKAAELDTWAKQVASVYKVLPMDAETFRLWAKLMHRRSDTVFEDAMIAACALQHKFTVATRNVRDFALFQAPLVNPFAAAASSFEGNANP